MEASQNKFKSGPSPRINPKEYDMRPVLRHASKTRNAGSGVINSEVPRRTEHHRTSKKKTELVRKILTLLGIVFSELVQTLFERNEMLL